MLRPAMTWRASAISEMYRPLGSGGILLKHVINSLMKREKSAERVSVIIDGTGLRHRLPRFSAGSHGLWPANYLIKRRERSQRDRLRRTGSRRRIQRTSL